MENNLFNFTGHGINVTEKMKDVALKQSEKIQEIAGEDLNSINIVCKQRGGLTKVELNVDTKNGLFRKEQEGESFERVYPELAKNIENQLREYNEKRKDLTEQRRRRQKENLQSLETETYIDQEEMEYNYYQDLIEDIRVKEISPKPMYTEDAIFEMEATDHNFYLYRDGETFNPTVIYKKNNGGYGILEMVSE